MMMATVPGGESAAVAMVPGDIVVAQDEHGVWYEACGTPVTAILRRGVSRVPWDDGAL